MYAGASGRADHGKPYTMSHQGKLQNQEILAKKIHIKQLVTQSLDLDEMKKGPLSEKMDQAMKSLTKLRHHHPSISLKCLAEVPTIKESISSDR